MVAERRRRRGDAEEVMPSLFPPEDWRSRAAGTWLESFVRGQGELRLGWDPEHGRLRSIG